MKTVSFFTSLTNIFVLLAVSPQPVLAQGPNLVWRDRSQDDLAPSPVSGPPFAYVRLCNLFGTTGKNCYVTEDCHILENGVTLCQVPPGDPEKLPQAVQFVVDQVNSLMERSALELGYSSLEELPQFDGDQLVQGHLHGAIDLISGLFVDRETQDRLSDGVEREFFKGQIPADEHPFRRPANRLMPGIAVSKSLLGSVIHSVFAVGSASPDGQAQAPRRARPSSPRK